MKILVIRFSSIGDVILATPVFDYLRKIHSNSQITFLTDKNYVELFSDDPRLNCILGLQKSDHIDQLSFINEHWDLVVDLQNNRRSNIIIDQIKTKQQTGTFQKLHFQRLLLLLTRINLYPRDSGVIPRYLQAAGLKSSTTNINKSIKLYFNSSKFTNYNKLVQSDAIIRPTIALFPFSAWKNKEWPADYFMTVGKYFISKGWNVVIFGSKSEQKQAEQLRLRIGEKAISLAGKLSLYECGCVLSNCTITLGNDSGLSHLARACGVKSAIVYGPTTHHFGFFPTDNPPFKILEAPIICRPCHPHGGNICFRFNHECMKKIEPEIVIRELLKLHHES